MIRLRGEKVTLRPFKRDEFDLVWQFRVRDAHPRSLPRGSKQGLRNRYARSGSMHDGFLDLAIEVGRRVVGEIDVRRPRGFPQGVHELGIAVFDETDRGKGFGREAIALLTAYAFTDLDAARVQGSTAVHNAAMRRVFEACGFRFEGVMRSFMERADGTVRDDYALYAITRADLEQPGS